MPIIVDDLANVEGMYHGDQKDQARRNGARHGHRWAHLTSTPDEDPDFSKLHAFAARLGMQRRWFDKDHYDLVPTKRALAVRLGAREVTRMEVSMVCLYDRNGRQRPEYGTPDKTARAPLDTQPPLL
jgi:hypothetical protein